jgi:hypothetical protein
MPDRFIASAALIVARAVGLSRLQSRIRGAIRRRIKLSTDVRCKNLFRICCASATRR